MKRQKRTAYNIGKRGNTITKIFPIILIVLDAAAGIVYLISGDMRRAIYWFAAAVLTVTVTF